MITRRIINATCAFVMLNSYANNRASSAPFISGDTFRSIAQHVYDETSQDINPVDVKNADIVFVKPDYMQQFVAHVLPNIHARIILIVHNSDFAFPNYPTDFLDDPKIIAVFAQNIESFSHPKLSGIPLGIANQCWPHGNVSLFKKHVRPFFWKKSKLLYMNFSASTYPKERSHVYNLFKDKNFCTAKQPDRDLEHYLSETAQHMFVLSPRGNGIDCHRTWEALLVGSIPIVRTSSLDPLYKDLPVVIVDNWEDVTEEFLVRAWHDLKGKAFLDEKRFASYWLNKIKCRQRDFLSL